MTDPAYTIEANLVVRASSVGVGLHVDDEPTPSLPIITDCISRASATIDFYCAAKYSQTGLAASRFVTKLATDLALWELFTRRGNPPPAAVASAAEAALAILEKIQAGTLQIPGVARALGMAPAVINHRVDLRRFPGSRTELGRSSDLARENSGYVRPLDNTGPRTN